MGHIKIPPPEKLKGLPKVQKVVEPLDIVIAVKVIFDRLKIKFEDRIPYKGHLFW